jgi:hypothetical protein
MSVVRVAVYCVLTASQFEGVKVTSAPLQLRVPLTIVFEGSRTTNVVLFTDDENKVSLNDTLIAALIGSAVSFTPGLVDITDGGVVSGTGPGPGPLAFGATIYPPPRSPHPAARRSAMMEADNSRRLKILMFLPVKEIVMVACLVNPQPDRFQTIVN